MNRNAKRCCVCLLFLGSLLLTSCGGRLTTYKVQGKCLYEGKPAAGAVVTFHKADKDDKSILPNGVVQQDGSFELTTYQQNDGIPAGDYNVVVLWERKRPGAKSTGGDDDDPGDLILPRRYYKPETSGLSVKVTKTTTTLEPFQLTK